MDNNNLGLRLALFAARHKLTVIDIAEATGATRQTVYNWFAGRPISPVYRKALAKFLSSTRKGGTK